VAASAPNSRAVPPGAPGSTASRINHCRNLQQTWAERHIATTDDEFVLQSTLPDTDSPLRVLEIKELGERIQGTLERLPDEYRLLLLLVADEETELRRRWRN
jgi:DNA-directed RNA polymerase specialized sigma24 family protein